MAQFVLIYRWHDSNTMCFYKIKNLKTNQQLLLLTCSECVVTSQEVTIHDRNITQLSFHYSVVTLEGLEGIS